MAYIYQIQNDINHKLYIGKTNFSIEKRFQEHCNDAFKRDKEHRPLYAAIRKYGIQHFHIRLLEETDSPEERERFWIEQKRSFKNGYNATKGGDGKAYLDYDVLIETYKKLKSLTETAKVCNCDVGHLSKILKSNNIKVLSFQQVEINKLGHTINQLDLQGNYIQTFPSAGAAARFLNKPRSAAVTSIMKVCKKKETNCIWL